MGMSNLKATNVANNKNLKWRGPAGRLRVGSGLKLGPTCRVGSWICVQLRSISCSSPYEEFNFLLILLQYSVPFVEIPKALKNM